MNKVTILCAMENAFEADIFMGAVEHSLESEHIKLVRVNKIHKVIETKYTQTAFMWDIRRQPLDGVLADALFGNEPFKQAYRGWLKVDAPYNNDIGLVDYICRVEKEFKFLDDITNWPKTNPYLLQNTIYAYLARGNGKSTIAANAVTDLLEHGFDGEKLNIPMARHCGKTALKQAFMEYYDCMKQADIPISKQLEECAEYCRKDVEMTSFLYKDFHLPKMETIRFNMPKAELPEIKNVIFNDPATIVIWADGTKTVVQCQDGDIYDPEKGLAMAISKKIMGNKHDYYHTFKHWLKRVNKEDK